MKQLLPLEESSGVWLRSPWLTLEKLQKPEVKQSRGEIVLFIEAMPQDKMPFYTRTGAMENFHLKFKFNSLGKQAKRKQVSPFFSNK